MNHLVRKFIVSGLACAGLVAGLHCAPAIAADDAVVTADKAVVAALAKGDKAAANKWLDPDFSWIDSEGIMWAKEDAFRGGLKPLVLPGDGVKIIEHKYGKSVVWIQWNQDNKYSARFWVKRPAGWKLLHTTEIAAMPKRDFQTVEPTYDIPCNNPCKAVPYKPISAGEKASLDEWQTQESSQENWEKHVASNLDQRVVSTYGGASPSKADRIIGMNKRKAANPNAPKQGAAPALWIRTWDFGDAVVMVSVQPTYGDKPYWSSRVLAPNDAGLWQMMESYHNYILASPVMTATPNQPDLK
ncbi:MAG TPA: hypothetical protein VHS08_03270 [Candidatus Acidoferrales bacterium]|jgi:hypothetical protein|nr:hypothetical protein [Candidatus Acidoferrales bacterium]